MVLKVKIGNNILASLTTKLDCVPGNITKHHGCIDDSEINFNCYCFEKSRVITDTDWGFPKETYIYGYRLALFPLEDLNAKYKIEYVDFQMMGKLLEPEFQTLISCLRDSRSVKRKYRRLLGANI